MMAAEFQIEHLNIIDLLGVNAGIAIVTKADRVEPGARRRGHRIHPRPARTDQPVCH